MVVTRSGQFVTSLVRDMNPEDGKLVLTTTVRALKTIATGRRHGSSAAAMTTHAAEITTAARLLVASAIHKSECARAWGRRDERLWFGCLS